MFPLRWVTVLQCCLVEPPNRPSALDPFSADMPRYCAVKVCSNRGGAASRHDNKRISFYPFPLQDKSRLQKWVDNMKREDWTPSRHQYLCSEHFTEDCFDIRWGIRYLKHTAVPTRFPYAEDDGEKKTSSIKRSPKAKPKTLDIEPSGFDSRLSGRPLILSRTCKKAKSGTMNSLVSGEAALVDLDVQTSPCELPEDSTASCLTLSSCNNSQNPEDQSDSIMTVFCCESLGDENVDAAALQAAISQTFSFVPVETMTDEPTSQISEKGGEEEEHISVYEHSYCRPDTDRDQLWRKILSLHAKILELDHREEKTLAKIHALEAEVEKLKRDGDVFKEKQKILEDYISSVLL